MRHSAWTFHPRYGRQLLYISHVRPGELNLYHNTMELETLQSPHLVGKAAILGICLDSDDKRLKHPYTCRSACFLLPAQRALFPFNVAAIMRPLPVSS